MTVAQLEADLQYLQQFHQHVDQYIAAVREYESLDSQALDGRAQEPDGPGFGFDELKRYNELKAELPQRRSSLNFDVLRVRNISNRYSLGFNEGWLFHMPASGRNNPNYIFNFLPDLENSINRDLTLVRAAIDEEIKHNQRQALRPRRRKVAEDWVVPVFHWFTKPDHSKYTVIAALIIVVAFFLWCLGYDAKGIVEIIKAFKGK